MPLSYISPIEKKINKTHFNFNTQEEITEKRGAEEISPENGKLTDLKGGSTFFLLLPSFFTQSSGIETGVGVLLL